MKSLRQYIRYVITESRFNQMSNSKITMLKSHLESSDFVNVDAEGDYDGEYNVLSSDAQEILINDLNDYMDLMFPPMGNINIEVKVDMMPTFPSEGLDSVLKSAQYWYDGLHNIGIILASMEEGHTLSELGNVSQKVYEVIAHELLHYMQFMKYSKGKPSIEKWDEFKKSYEEEDISSKDEDYFFFDPENGPSELETFSYQIANELRRTLEKSEASNLINLLIKASKSLNSNSDLKATPEFKDLIEISPSLKSMEKRNVDFNRPEFIDMVKRIKHYIKRIHN